MTLRISNLPEHAGCINHVDEWKDSRMRDPIDDEDDDCELPPPGPLPNQLRKEAAERGDVDFFLDIFRTKAWSMFSVGEMLRHLVRAAEDRARTDPENYAQELFGTMIGFNSFLLLRTQLLIADRVVGRGPHLTTPTMVDLAPDVIERLLPRLIELQQSTAELLVAQAQVVRLQALTRAKQAQADRVVQADPQQPRHSSGGKPRRSRSSAATPGAAEPHDGVVPLPTRSRRRG